MVMSDSVESGEAGAVISTDWSKATMPAVIEKVAVVDAAANEKVPKATPSLVIENAVEAVAATFATALQLAWRIVTA